MRSAHAVRCTLRLRRTYFVLGLHVGKKNQKMKLSHEIFFVLQFLVIFIFLFGLKIFFLAFLFFMILQFASPQVARAANWKIMKNENTKNKIFRPNKKIKITKNCKKKIFRQIFCRQYLTTFNSEGPIRSKTEKNIFVHVKKETILLRI